MSGNTQQQPPHARPRYTHDDYPIGVICALAVEKAAFVAMLDEEHEILPTSKHDDNSYTFGRIGIHNVVAACLPAGLTGNNSAATVAKDMLRSFPIKIGLMVGIGGGVWSEKVDVRLGDVVVSQPEGKHGGVVQWDFGKMEHNGFKRTGSLNKPPRLLLHAVQELKIVHITDGDRLADHLSEMVQNKPRMARTFIHQGTEHDYLYSSAYTHAGGDTCDSCDPGQTVKRQPRPTLDPYVHYGNIASGNEVIKDGPTRDRIAQEEGIMCFEMEAAGLMDSFPCLVIRGICDYADSHKNKRWQPYAAATAAAFAKELLGVIKKQGLDELEPAKVSPYQTQFTLQGVPQVAKFVDRPAEMAALEGVLLPRAEPNQRQKVQVLHGLGGMGKTQLAVEFARRHHRQFTSVFWIDGRSKDILKRSIAIQASRIPSGQIAETSRSYAADSSANVDAVVKDVMNWLARPDNTSWLLVFDNVDREYNERDNDADAYDVRLYLSGADHGSVLITTRLARLRQLGDSQPLGKVGQEQARAILECWYKEEQDTTESKRLLELLDGLPLAIAQAGAFLQESGTGINTYLGFYERQWSELMESGHLIGAPLQDYPERNIWTTWAISYQAIYDKHEHTAKLLLLWSFLDNRNLWYGLFAEASEDADVVASMLSNWIGDIANSELAFVQAMQLLRSYSLVEKVTETTGYATHPVVHRWAHHYQGKQYELELRQLAIVAVGAAVPNEHRRDASRLQRQLLPHAQVCSGWAMRRIQGQRSESADGPGRSEGCGETNLKSNEERAIFLAAMTCLGDLHLYQGKLTEAERIYKYALQGEEEVIGSTHPLTLETVNNLGIVYRIQGRLVEAERMHKRALQSREKMFGSAHPSILQSVNNLGIVYRDQGKQVEAEHMFKQTLQGAEETLGSAHPRTLDTVYNLGVTYWEQGKLAEAKQMYKRALQGREEALGSTHPLTLRTVNNLGVVYKDQGKLAEAEQMYERALQGYKEAFGETQVRTYRPTLNTLYNMGNLHVQQGDYAKARGAYESALTGLQSILGPSHSDCEDILAQLEWVNWKIEHGESVSELESESSSMSGSGSEEDYVDEMDIGDEADYEHETDNENSKDRRSKMARSSSSTQSTRKKRG